MPLDVVVLVSAGRHPLSGRPRRADLDARALELALTLPDARVEALHAGPRDGGEEAALRDYLGMGLPSLTLLELREGHDPAFALLRYLEGRRPALLLAGQRAEAGACSGFLPYWLAERLGYPLLAGLTALAGDPQGWRATLAAGGGRRRMLALQGSFLATLDEAAPPARMSAFARAKRGEIRRLPAGEALPPLEEPDGIRPARRRPKRLAGPGQAAAVGRQALVGLDGEAAARTILDYLAREGLLPDSLKPPG